jgi:hypothetical protein
MALGGPGLTAAQMFGTEYVISMFVFTIIFNSLILLFITKRFAFRNSRYGYALLVTFLTACVSLFFEFSVPLSIEVWMLPVYYVIDVFLICVVYSEGLVKSLKAGFVWWILAAVVSSVLGLVIGVVLAAVGIAAGVQPLIPWLFPA